ncbi:nitrate/nitrite transporter NrtS [Novipirellula sp. SH528]|uniref:nitrate/nitrite transporter NrtS n=1 Tax=Novipirellula sp. SH528 TaxID=3454466 RepID=UPI003F9F8DA7
MKSWLQLALSRTVVLRALGYSVFVGTLLVVINHGDVLLNGELTTGMGRKMGLTYLVPYAVSTLSSVGAMRNSLRN